MNEWHPSSEHPEGPRRYLLLLREDGDCQTGYWDPDDQQWYVDLMYWHPDYWQEINLPEGVPNYYEGF